ncbi:hypothetical protein [Archaeoglobus sp.]
MKGFIEELIERVKRSKVFKRNKKSLEVKILAAFIKEDEFIYVDF